jgi:hypothetical protein
MMKDLRQLSNFYSVWTSASDNDGAVSWVRGLEGNQGSTERNRKNGGEKKNKQGKINKKIISTYRTGHEKVTRVRSIA